MLSEIRYTGRKKSTVLDTFRGIRPNRALCDGYLSDAYNMSDEEYPAIRVREKRSVMVTLENALAFAVLDGIFFWVIKENGKYNAYRADKEEPLLQDMQIDEEKRHHIVKMTNYFILFPEGYVLCGARESTVIGTSTTYKQADEKIAICENIFSIGDGKYGGLDAAKNRVTVYLAGNYQKFYKDDGVHVWQEDENGDVVDGTETYAVIREVSQGIGPSGRILQYLDFYENTFSQSVAPNEDYSDHADWFVAREMPDMDFVFASNNRLWGCKGSKLYASVMGDPYNWNVFESKSWDSWQWDSGGEGEFTGGADVLGTPVFFKEHAIVRVLGTTGAPSEYETREYPYFGVKKGCGDSIQTAGKYVFYLGVDGVYAYSGGVPARVSGMLSERMHANGVAVSDSEKYYLCCENAAGESALYVYNTTTGNWYVEQCDGLAPGGGYQDGLWVMDKNGRVMTLGAYNGVLQVSKEDAISWRFETGDFIQGAIGAKYLSRIVIRYGAEKGARFDVEISYNGEESWRTVGRVDCKQGRSSCSFPIVSRRADSVRIRVSGEGNVTVYQIALEGQSGSTFVR